MKNNRLIFSILVLMLVSLIAGQGITKEKVYAIVLGEKITSSDLKLDPAYKKKKKESLSLENYKEWGRKAKIDKFNGIILRKILDDYARVNKIKVSEKEIEEMTNNTQSSMRKETLKIKGQVAVMKKRLKDPKTSEQEKNQLKRNIESFEKFIKMQKEAEKANSKKKKRDPKEKKMLSWFVKHWKINQSLYKRYGGRVIFQQAGYEPVGAYASLVKEQKKKGKLKIFSSKYSRNFWNTFPMGGSEVSKTRADKYFEKPWWTWTEKELREFKSR